jgi:small-conductance mechanosensitive channel
VTNIKGEVLLALWDALNEHRIEIPMPQRAVHIRELASPTQPRAREAQSAQD